jgi:hypothetical protein
MYSPVIDSDIDPEEDYGIDEKANHEDQESREDLRIC